MRQLLLGAVIFAFSVPALAEEPADKASADRQKGHHIVIKTIGGDEDIDIKGLLDQIKAEADGLSNVFVTVDDEGNMSVDEELHGRHHVRILNMDDIGGPGLHFRHGFGQKPMSQDAAECVLKSLGKVQTEGHANLLREACVTIHPVED
jgi:hypothetical protein